MKTIAWSEGTWTREPVSVNEQGATLAVEAAAESDWWRTTAYGFIHDDGHALIKEFPNESAVEVSFILNSRKKLTVQLVRARQTKFIYLKLVNR